MMSIKSSLSAAAITLAVAGCGDMYGPNSSKPDQGYHTTEADTTAGAAYNGNVPNGNVGESTDNGNLGLTSQTGSASTNAGAGPMKAGETSTGSTNTTGTGSNIGGAGGSTGGGN